MNHEEPEAVVVCVSCKGVLRLHTAAFDGKNYRHIGCHHQHEKALDNARDYQSELASYRREKDGE
jgi:hypothetical protein